MKNNTLLDAWIASWKFHILFYPFWLLVTFGMLPELSNPSNENPMGVIIAVHIIYYIFTVCGFGRFAWIWYKNINK